jgi:hypothetical protein
MVIKKPTDLNRVASTVRNALLKSNVAHALDSLRRVPQEFALEVLAVAVEGVEPVVKGKLLQTLGFSGDGDMDVFDILGAEPLVFDTDDSDFFFFS